MCGWTTGSDLDREVESQLNRAIDDVITPQITLIRQKAKNLQDIYSNLGNYILQKVIIYVVYVVLFTLLALYLYSNSQRGAFKNLFSFFTNFA